jgi:hypothetical protein
MKWKGVFDIHSHIGSRKGKEYSANDALKRMDLNHIERAVVCHFIGGFLDREDFRRANDYIIEAVKSHPDRFLGLCVLTPVHGNFALEEFKRCLDLGLSGIKLHPDKHGLYSLSGPMIEALMVEVESTGAFVFIHSDFHSKVCSPYDITDLARSFPKAKILMGHFGLDQDLCEKIPSIVEHTPNVFLDTSQTVDHPEAIFVSSTEKLGPGRVLFGSDAPIISPEVNLKKLEVAMDYYHLAPNVAQAIVRDNALRVLSGVPNARV